ncbi:hypothetical protein GCM10023205_31940 [Yinghuangia aomiensis]|uniref:Translation initiation factor IF-2 n=1 Tax=Yinghuangia aomiensis TaxID=676205 RepID=A0ABP9HA01_9ACTN
MSETRGGFRQVLQRLGSALRREPAAPPARDPQAMWGTPPPPPTAAPPVRLPLAPSPAREGPAAWGAPPPPPSPAPPLRPREAPRYDPDDSANHVRMWKVANGAIVGFARIGGALPGSGPEEPAKPRTPQAPSRGAREQAGRGHPPADPNDGRRGPRSPDGGRQPKFEP